MNVFLTGGAGYIGSHAALSLLDSGHNVHIVDNLSTGNESLIPKNAKFTKITKAGFYESMVHSVEMTEKAINYKL